MTAAHFQVICRGPKAAPVNLAEKCDAELAVAFPQVGEFIARCLDAVAQLQN